MTQVDTDVDPPLAYRHVQTVLLSFAILLLGLSFVGQRSLNKNASHSRTVRVSIDLNQAEPRELALLPGVGPVLANRIAENRARLGPYRSVEDLGRVHGIGPKTLQQVAIYCTATQDRHDLVAENESRSVGR